MPRRLDRLVRSIGLGPRLGPHIHRNRSYRHGVPHTPSPPKSFTLNLIVPPSSAPETIEFPNKHTLERFLASCNGSLYSLGSKGQKKMWDHLDPLSPFQTYEVLSPYSVSMQSIQHYEQNSDKGFEDKSRKALMTYMKKEGMIFNELARVIKVNDKTVAEWEGLFEVDVDGVQHLYFLECKHKMIAVYTSLSPLC